MIVVELRNGERMYAGYRVSFFDGWVKLFAPHRFNHMTKEWKKMGDSWLVFPKEDVELVRRNELRVD